MEIVSRQSILKYLNITLLSYSRICHFTPAKEPDKRIKCRFINISSRDIRLNLGDIPRGLDGHVVFYSYTFIFRFRTRLRAASEVGDYYCDIPKMIETFDRRKYARLKFESRENMVVSIRNKSLNSSIKGILTDISAGGLGFTVVHTAEAPKAGDLIVTDVSLKEKMFQVMAEVAQVRGDHVGCVFLEKSVKFQLELNAMVKQEIDWRSEHMLNNLRKREEMVKSFHKAKEKSDQAIRDISKKLTLLEPFIEHFINDFHIVTDIVLSQDTAEYRESTAPSDLHSLFLNSYFNSDLLFKVYFSGQRDILHRLAKPVFGDRLGGRGINASIVLEELGAKLSRHTGRPGESNHIFTYSGPKVVETNKRMLSDLLRLPSIRIGFTSSIGDFTMLLLAENLHDALNLCDKARAKEFITMEKMDLIEPISYATLNVFSELLKLDIREKSVTTRDRLVPRFEISVLLDIFFEKIDGKVILNLSKKLAFKIYELLLGEQVEEFDADVKDAIAEVTNMITGNAKSEFEKQGIYYKISTPVVLESREGVVIYAKNMRFLSSVYWSSEGFFDLSFSFFKK
jgi:chemotaxis protein CheX